MAKRNVTTLDTTSPNALASERASFEQESARVMQAMSDSFAELMAAMPSTIDRAVDLERAMRVDKKLAWQVFRIARAPNPLTEVANVPAPTSFRRLMDAAKTCKASKALLQRLEESDAGFRRCVNEHGGDRESLVSLVSGAGSDRNEDFDLKVRKALFRGQSHVWGVKSRMQARTEITVPSRNGSGVTVAIIGANIAIQRMRSGCPVVLGGYAANRDSVPGDTADNRRFSFKLMEAFSSKPLPVILPRENADGRVELELTLPEIGLSGAATAYLRHINPDGLDPRKEKYRFRLLTCTPCEEAVHDIMIPAGWTDPSTARTLIYGRRYHPDLVFEERPVDLLPQREVVEYLGQHTQPPSVHGAPNQRDAVQSILDEIGGAGLLFDVYRCRILFPVLHTLIVTYIDTANAYRTHPVDAREATRGSDRNDASTPSSHTRSTR